MVDYHTNKPANQSSMNYMKITGRLSHKPAHQSIRNSVSEVMKDINSTYILIRKKNESLIQRVVEELPTTASSALLESWSAAPILTAEPQVLPKYQHDHQAKCDRSINCWILQRNEEI